MLCSRHEKQAALKFIIPVVSNSTLLKLLTTSKKNKNHILQTLPHLTIQGKQVNVTNCTTISTFCNLQSIAFINRSQTYYYVPVDLSKFSHLQRKTIRALKFCSMEIHNFKLLKHFINLESLELKECQTPQSKVSTDLSNCTSLQKLTLKCSRTSALLNEDISYLQYMTKLEQLSLRMSLLDFSPLKHL
eukprot:Awhi_evm2s3228